MPQKIAFIKVRSFSFINPKLIEQVERTFGDRYTIEVFDLKDWLIAHKPLLAMAYAEVWKEYWPALLRRKKRPNECLFVTEFIFDQIKRAVNQRINSRDYAFTFQTQTLFDASVPGVPHFVYTDHTVRANLHYPVIDRQKVLFSDPWMALEPEVYLNATKVFTASNFARDSVIGDYAIEPERVACVYTGMNVAIDPPANKDYAGQHIVFVGVEWERKGGPETVAAFRQALAVCPQARLTIVGCTPDIDLPNCTVVGRVPKEEVARYLREATIFCMPSRIEPAGIAFTEAAMYKLPVLSANSGGIPDRVIHGETGYLVDVGDSETLARYLIELLQNPEKCRAMGEAGYRLASEHFTWERVGEVIHDQIVPYLAINTPARHD
jgi:glycosyltransferase involved in cell wall biosynthesis